MNRARYGFDAPVFLIGLTAGAVVFAIGAVLAVVFAGWPAALWPILVTLWMTASALIYWHTTTRGKFTVWTEVLDRLALRGDERVLDMGCGRGAVLMLVAKRLTTGRATGADLWRRVDQSGNAIEVTRANAAAEGVTDRIDLDTADMTALPYPDGSFDLVVASMAIHNIHPAARRNDAIDEAVRVLRPGGRLAIVDISATAAYRRRLADLGIDADLRPLGRRMWWGGPWVPTSLVSATKP
jgi:SAM-dependent methyltransferase